MTSTQMHVAIVVWAASCGDGVVQLGVEDCDNGANNGNLLCSNNCSNDNTLVNSNDIEMTQKLGSKRFYG